MNKKNNQYQYCKILIVDDTPKNLDILSQTLLPLGCQLAFATSGQQMLDIVPSLLPDIILLDVMMPGINGFEACQLLKASKLTKISHIPVIFVTAMSETEHLKQGFEVGGVDYIGKPIKTEEVIARTQAHLDIQILSKTQLETINALETTLEERSDDVSSMGLDLRNQLNALLGYTDMLRDDVKDSQIHELIHGLDMIDQAGHQILHSISNVLDMAKISAGKMPLHIDQFDLYDLLESIFYCIQGSSTINENKVVSGQHLLMRSDPEKIKQILLNLLGGVYNISQRGEVSMAVAKTATDIRFILYDRANQDVVIEHEIILQDDVYIDKMFIRNFGGTSLTASVNQKLSDLLSGKLSIENSQSGPVFILQLPISLDRVLEYA